MHNKHQKSEKAGHFGKLFTESQLDSFSIKEVEVSKEEESSLMRGSNDGRSHVASSQLLLRTAEERLNRIRERIEVSISLPSNQICYASTSSIRTTWTIPNTRVAKAAHPSRYLTVQFDSRYRRKIAQQPTASDEEVGLYFRNRRCMPFNDHLYSQVPRRVSKTSLHRINTRPLIKQLLGGTLPPGLPGFYDHTTQCGRSGRHSIPVEYGDSSCAAEGTAPGLDLAT